MIESAESPVGKTVRYTTQAGLTWLHVRDVFELLGIKYQTKKLKGLATRKFKTLNCTLKQVNQMYVVKRDLVHLYKKSKQTDQIRWLTATFEVKHLQKNDLPKTVFWETV